MAYKDKEKEASYHKKWFQDNKERLLSLRKEWIKNNPERWRATQLLCAYRQSDKKADRGKGDLTIQWIIDNILSKPCSHCGKTGWDVIGCNRLDNSKPHTMDNVEPCCKECNTKELKLERDELGRYKKMV